MQKTEMHTNCVREISGGKGKPCVLRWGKTMGSSSCYEEARVLFVDIDGVLNRLRLTRERIGGKDGISGGRGGIIGIERRLAERLNALIRLVGAEAVLSSSWRHSATWRQDLAIWGVDTSLFIDETPSIGNGIRGEEIDQWLSEHQEVTKYAILDDESDFLPHQPLFKTEGLRGGLTEDIYWRIVQHFAV